MSVIQGHVFMLLESSLAELYFDLSDLLLLRIRVQLMSKFSINRDIIQNILEFTGYRDYGLQHQVANLTGVAAVLNTDVAGFFFGGIESCLGRKHGINSDCWTLILEFAGYRREMPSINVLPSLQEQWSP